MKGRVPEIGERFGRWTVIDNTVRTARRKSCPACVCKCECGNIGIVPNTELRSGRSKSCGCWKGGTDEEDCREREGDRMKSRFTSRKFILCVAIVLGSVATAIAGFATDNEIITLVGVVCGVISTSLYTICETVIDCENSAENSGQEYEDGGITTTVYCESGEED